MISVEVDGQYLVPQLARNRHEGCSDDAIPICAKRDDLLEAKIETIGREARYQTTHVSIRTCSDLGLKRWQVMAIWLSLKNPRGAVATSFIGKTG